MDTNIRGTRRHSSPSSFQGEHSTYSYAPRGTYGIRLHNGGGSARSNSHPKDYSQYEGRSPRGHLSDDCASTQHYHNHQRESLSYHTPNSNGNTHTETRKRKTTTSICIADAPPPSAPGEPWTNDEWQTTNNGLEVHTRLRTGRTPAYKRTCASNSDDESNYVYVNDTRQESKYSGKSDYKLSARIYSRSGREPDSTLEDHYPRDNDIGRERHEDGQGGEGVGFHEERQPDSSFNTNVLCRKKLWVGGLPSNITCEEIRKYFEVFGKLIYVMISPKGNAFVKFTTEEQALFAYRKCYTAYIAGKLAKVKYAIRKPNKIPHNKLLYINNVPSTYTRTDLKREFEKFGEIEDVQMFTVPYLYFFVTFFSEDSAVRARKALKTKYFIQFGKNRVEDKTAESPEATRTVISKEHIREQPPDISECKVFDVLEPLSDSQTLELSELLNDLKPTNSAIRIRRDWILEHTANINDILLHISVMLVAKDNPFTLRLSTLFLIHDLLSYCTQRRICTEILDTVSALTLPHLQRVINKFHVDSEEQSKSVLNILSLWEKYSVFPVAVVEDLVVKFKTGGKDIQGDEV